MQRVLSIVIGLVMVVPVLRYETGLFDRAAASVESVSSQVGAVEPPSPAVGDLFNQFRRAVKSR